MVKKSKRFKECQKLFDKDKKYKMKEAISILKSFPCAKFDETAELSIKLNIDLKAKDDPQPVRGTVVLPHGTGKKVRIIAFCKGEDLKKAQEEKVDFAGETDLIEKINSGWLDFDVAISTPEMMKDVSRLGKILGPRGLMPSPKAGTVTSDIRGAVRDIKSGKVEFKMDKGANIHMSIGKASFAPDMLYENSLSLINAIIHLKHSSSKGQYFKSVFISTTMGPAINLDTSGLK